ncbi:MAG: HAMP domain-containing sensor histidine kinase, partial [Burkholderiaceae bacterium]|nr:HAMP domain-containing sensor histidine kinase [Burkholderiaceae bacterium]
IPADVRPLVEAINHHIERNQQQAEASRRFIDDASHQLRTPLAVLKTQVQSALRGDLDPRQALQEIGDTVDRATLLANQMLALAKVEQLRQQSTSPTTRLDEVLRTMALEISPLIAQRDLDFGIHTEAAPIRAHEWMLRELTRNLLHNAVRHAPPGSVLSVELRCDGVQAILTVSDQGPGIDAELAARLFQPFSAGDTRSGSGLGLAICHEIASALGGSIALHNRLAHDRVVGLDATVQLPCTQPSGREDVRYGTAQ